MPPSSPESVLQVWVSEVNPCCRHGFMACHTIIRERGVRVFVADKEMLCNHY